MLDELIIHFGEGVADARGQIRPLVTGPRIELWIMRGSDFNRFEAIFEGRCYHTYLSCLEPVSVLQ